MQIELLIDGELKTFTTPFVPMSAKRKYLEIEARAEERKEPLPLKEQLEEDNEILSIMTDIVFKNQFTLDQLYDGCSKEYFDQKMLEAIFGVKPSDLKKESDKGNGKGK